MRIPNFFAMFSPMFFAAATITCTLAFTPVFAGNASPPDRGGVLPEIRFPTPDEARAKRYLGISGDQATFTIGQIKAKVVILEVLSMYCPRCQREAPRVNELYDAIQWNKDLEGAFKIIGIGAGNSSYEVNLFRKKYDIQFPLLPDEDYSIHDTLGELKTPYFIGVRLFEDGTHKVIYSKRGPFERVDSFLATMVELSR